MYQYGWARLDDVARVFGSQRTVDHFLVHTSEAAAGRVIEKRREYAVLKAIGFTNGRLYALVFQQSAIVAGTGFLGGCGPAVAVAWFAEIVQPVFVATIGWQDLWFTAGAAAPMAFIASFIPARPLVQLHPAEAFRA